MGHHVEIGAGNEIICKQPVADGTMRVLMLLGPERQAAFSDAPTVKELGYENAIVEVYMGLIGPPGMDLALVKYIDEATKSICQNPEFVAHIKAIRFNSNLRDLRCIQGTSGKDLSTSCYCRTGY
jgi:tripartite-type tricarboxylate transporter receptor subunit TctC